ncbi:MAG: ATP-binding protein [Gammaproteobacteria bacterium]|nr:ATP-binding protein [Gammaproteobacteria bacterium]
MRIKVKAFGPIADADVTFGDLTVLVGPQATGKSILLQLLKLLLDRRSIHAEMHRFGLEWADAGEFSHLYFGEGSALLESKASTLLQNGRKVELAALSKRRKSKEGEAGEALFYIPAQRVMGVRDGFTHPFSDYHAGDPFVLRAFSDKLHQLVQTDFSSSGRLFPQRYRLKQALREPLAARVFPGFELRMEVSQMQRRFVLRNEEGTVLPYLVWSAGQREFTPLLLGFYHLLPPARTSGRGLPEWVVIEEPEMGLHPYAITAVLAVVMELISRGYRVCLSTHSSHVLDLMWALRFMQDCDGTAADVLKLLGVENSRQPPASRKAMMQLAESVLARELRVYFFPQGEPVQDISQLDPGAEEDAERGWGGLTEFAGTAGEVVAEVANRRG